MGFKRILSLEAVHGNLPRLEKVHGGGNSNGKTRRRHVGYQDLPLGNRDNRSEKDFRPDLNDHG